MKKVFSFLAVAFIVALLASSCKSSQKCAAYGETHKFQKEVKY